MLLPIMVFSWAWFLDGLMLDLKLQGFLGQITFHDLNAEGNVNLDSIPQRVGAFRNMVRTLDKL